MVKSRSPLSREEARREKESLAAIEEERIHIGLWQEILGDVRLADGRTVAERGRDRVVKNLSDFYRKSRQIEDLVQDFVGVYVRASRRLETFKKIDPEDAKARARAIRAMTQDSQEFHEIIEGMQNWCKRNRQQVRTLPDDTNLIARAIKRHRLRGKSSG